MLCGHGNTRRGQCPLSSHSPLLPSRVLAAVPAQAGTEPHGLGKLRQGHTAGSPGCCSRGMSFPKKQLLVSIAHTSGMQIE